MKARRKPTAARLKNFGKLDGPKPACKSGYRNIYCPQYGQCLDFVVKKSWERWACVDCPHKKQIMILDDFPATHKETVLYHTLPQEFHLQAG